MITKTLLVQRQLQCLVGVINGAGAINALKKSD